MFGIIEDKFKSLESRKRNRIFIILCFVIYVIVAVIMLNQIEKNRILFIVPVLIFVLLIYVCIVIINWTNKLYTKEKWFYIFRVCYSLKLFKNNQRQNDKLFLIGILKDNDINTRPKVGKILDHYRALIPRNINEKTTIISVLAFLISILAFLYDSNLNILYDKIVSLLSVFIFGGIGWFVIRIFSKEVTALFGKGSFYLRMEDLLTEIYIKSDIK